MAGAVRARGLIEGFYGQPWTHEERLDLIRFCGEHGLDTWVHAPKHDPYHRRRWREPYPDAELERFRELAGAAERHGVELVWAIAPGLDVCCSRDEELEALLAKCAQLRAAGVRSFHLLWDDVEHALNCAEDERLYGHEERPSAAAQAAFSNRVARELDQPGPLVVCPMGYAGTAETPYRRIFGARLEPGAVVYWTGPDVVSRAIRPPDVDAAARSFGGHELLLWDNYPANDFSPDLLFLGPLRGRDPRIAPRLRGVVANGMVQAVPSKLALATVADWAREPAAYDPVASFERALRRHGAEVLEALRRLPAGLDGAAPAADLPQLVAALGRGVDAGTAVALLEPFV